jgi:phosphoglycolate phosphatase
MPRPRAVFFDLDGTLADTAPDLGMALNRLLEEEGRPPVPAAVLRPHVSAGSRGLLAVGFQLTPADAAYPGLQKRFLDHYAAALCVGTTLFPGMAELLEALDRIEVRWGVVTNKPRRFTEPLMTQLGIAHRAAAVVSGDSTAYTKPHPEPLLFACAAAGVAAQDALYVGDDLRDIQAGRAAGMRTAIAAYGYLGENPCLGEWQADATIAHPAEVLGLLGLAC